MGQNVSSICLHRVWLVHVILISCCQSVKTLNCVWGWKCEGSMPARLRPTAQYHHQGATMPTVKFISISSNQKQSICSKQKHGRTHSSIWVLVRSNYHQSLQMARQFMLLLLFFAWLFLKCCTYYKWPDFIEEEVNKPVKSCKDAAVLFFSTSMGKKGIMLYLRCDFLKTRQHFDEVFPIYTLASLHRRAWLMITVTLASLLLIPLVVRLIGASWRRLIFSYSYRKVQRATSTEKHCLSECLIFTDNTRGSARQM